MKCQLLLLAVLSTVLAACEAPSEGPASTTQAPIQVGVTHVRRGTISEVLAVTGETAALSVLRLGSPVAGRITWLQVRAGDQLQSGAVAARVIPLENQAALHGFAVLDRSAQSLHAEQEATRQLRDQIAARDIPLRVPFPAVVAERLHNPDEQVAPNDVLLELFDPRSLYVLAQVPAREAPRVQAGMPVEVSFGGRVVLGEVAALLTAMAPQTVTVPVRIALSTPMQPALLHAAVQCRITVARHADARLIPRSALLSSAAADHAVIMVAADNRAEQRPVQLGLRTLDEVEVTAGLGDDDVVLVQGQYSLPDGTPIEPLAVTE